MSSYKTALAVAAITLATPGVHAWYKNLPMCVDSYTPFTHQGCYDNAQPGALLERMDMDANNMTVEACTATCKGNAFGYAALGYTGTCYCGNTLNTKVADDKLCNRQCSGNSAQTCGGDSSVAVYKDTTFPDLSGKTTDVYTPEGCYTDDAGARPVFFRQENLKSGSLSTKACLTSCLAGGFPYAATEYADECYCGVVLGSGASNVSHSECSMPCSGAPGEMCGGPARQSVYHARELESYEPCGYVPPGPPVTYSVSSIPATYKPSTPVSTLAESSPVSTPTGYGYTTPTPIIGTATSTIAESSPVSPPASYGATTSTDVVSIPTTSTIAESSPVSSPVSTPATEVASTSPTLPASSSTPIVTPSTSPSTPVESTTSTQPASSPTSPSSYVVSVPSSSTTTIVPTSPTTIVSIPSTFPTTSPTSGVSSTQAVSTPASTTPVTSRITTPVTLPPSTLKTSTTSVATAPGVCTSVVVAPPKCEFSCGKFCYTLPEWKDSKGCSDAWSHCMVNVASCYVKAGIPDALNCVGFAQWCGKVKDYCGASPKGSKDSCTKAWPPVKPTLKPELTTTTMTVACASVATTSQVAAVSSNKPLTSTKPVVLTTTTLTTPPPTTTATTTCAIATPTGICQQPKNTASGYDVGSPLGGIKLPALTCNNVEAEHKAGNIYKLYTEQDTKKCASFKAPQVADACSQACRAQYDQCMSVYAEGCRTKGKYNGKTFGLGYSPSGAFVGSQQPRSYPLLGARTDDATKFADTYDGAKTKCVSQWRDCLTINKSAVSEKCKKYGVF